MRTFTLITIVCVFSLSAQAEERRGGTRGTDAIYQANCAICHGEQMQGTAQGSALVGVPLKHGATNTDLMTSISEGFPTAGMPPWKNQLNPQELTYTYGNQLIITEMNVY